jgi:hypothetical protein
MINFPLIFYYIIQFAYKYISLEYISDFIGYFRDVPLLHSNIPINPIVLISCNADSLKEQL